MISIRDTFIEQIGLNLGGYWLCTKYFLVIHECFVYYTLLLEVCTMMIINKYKNMITF